MPTTAIFCGVLLIAIGLIGYFYGVSTGAGSLTALIPAGIGAIIAILGVAARRNEGPRKHLMHGAILIALFGFGMTVGRLIAKRDFTGTPADISSVATALVCLILIVMGVRSFMSARVSRL